MRATAGVRRGAVGLCAAALILAGCSGSDEPEAKPEVPEPTETNADCGELRIAYDPSNGYEASAFILGQIAADELDCDVSYVETGTRQSWRLLARGEADVYMDSYGSPELREELAGEDGPLTVVGRNGIRGGVDLLAPAFMGDRGLVDAQDLNDTDRIGWGSTTPAITTVPALIALAESFVEFQGLDYAVRNLEQVRDQSGMRFLMNLPAQDDARGQPNVYLVEGPRMMLGVGPDRQFVDIPESAANDCVPDRNTTTCSLADFDYEKVVSKEFAESGSPAYSLVFNYQLSRADAATIVDLVVLSGYDVGAPDVASWVNTHKEVWRRWLE